MLQPGLPSPCIADRHTITRAHWMPGWLRQGAPPLQGPHVAARLPEPLHRRQAHHHARPLDAGLVAAGAAMTVAPAAGRGIDAPPAPLPGARAPGAGRAAGLL